MTKEAQEKIRSHFGDPDAELDPELEACSFVDDNIGRCIKHPLVYSIMHMPQLNDTMNKMLAQKKRMLQDAFDEGNWNRVVFTYERAWRLHAFANVLDPDKLDDQTYWGLLGDIWTDSENIWERQDDWEQHMSSERPEREYLMEAEERDAFKLLPDRIRVHRGYRRKDRQLGMSWSLTYARAEWFANRFAGDGEGFVVTGYVAKDKALALFLGRGEDEIVAFPDDIEVEEVKRVVG